MSGLAVESIDKSSRHIRLNSMSKLLFALPVSREQAKKLQETKSEKKITFLHGVAEKYWSTLT